MKSNVQNNKKKLNYFRQEFGSNEGPPADSGYVSHSSGGHYPR